MIVDDTLVRRLEHLAALSLEPEERAGVAADLTRFLGYVDELGGTLAQPSVEATGDEPAPAALRPDQAVAFPGRAEALGGAPELDGSAFLVPRFNP